MANSDLTLKNEVRVFTRYSEAVLDNQDLDTVISRAKNHIRTKKGITEDNFDWYADQYREEALFWYTCVFSKVITGELDSQTVQVGAIDIDSLLAQDDGEVTTWVRKAQSALRTLDTGGDYPHGVAITSPTRENRVYGDDGADTDTTGQEDLL